MEITEITEFSEDLSGVSAGQVPDGDLVPMLQELQALQRVIAAVSADLAAEAETRSLYLR
ncbi:hypothetical protein [Allokutzneria albata]|uniref:Uncharacterized protein n=1 Tax=Allokutzneria albata TaxID=211114 RepID=A0A1G9REC6_ALLAB|nr:hypothetical protein [Allokutzneria albata]SDM21531.1 hypothetical protein SAMN04489726_0403 [Allokutzneria albata]